MVIFVTKKYKMSARTELVEKLEGIDNFRAWKYRIGLILAENDLARFIKEEVCDVPFPRVGQKRLT